MNLLLTEDLGEDLLSVTPIEVIKINLPSAEGAPIELVSTVNMSVRLTLQNKQVALIES